MRRSHRSRRAPLSAKKRPQALSPAPAGSPEPAALLASGDVRVKGRMPWSSNATFLVEVVLDGASALAIYKPERGERPLWDFPRGLYRREIAAYLLSEALGWGLVPLTITRDGPYGEGSFQLFVHADFEQHYYTLVEDRGHHERLRREGRVVGWWTGRFLPPEVARTRDPAPAGYA